MVCALLEKHNICSKESFIRSRTFEEGKIIVREYQQKIMGHEVQAFFETYIETNETFLQNGWVLK